MTKYPGKNRQISTRARNQAFSESEGVFWNQNFCSFLAERCLQEEKSPEIHPQLAESLQQMERASFTLFPEDNVNCSPWRERDLPTHLRKLRFQPQDIHRAAPEAVRERERERAGGRSEKKKEEEKKREGGGALAVESGRESTANVQPKQSNSRQRNALHRWRNRDVCFVFSFLMKTINILLSSATFN